MNDVQMDITNWIKDGFDLFKSNFGVLVLVALIALILSCITFFILLAPMSAGIFFITLKLYDNKGQTAEMGDLFKGFGVFLQSLFFLVIWGMLIFMASIILGLIPAIGGLASICLQVTANAFLMFALPLIVDKKMDFWPASIESINKVKTNFWPFLGLSLIAGVLCSVGVIAIGIGVIFTLPIYFCIITVAYRNVF